MAAYDHIDPWANESKATLRYLAKRSGVAEQKCLAALRNAQGKIAVAIRELAPWLPSCKFPEWYYLGPYVRVDDPDRDLPNRERLELTDQDRLIERTGNFDGERLIAPFNDANSIEEIYGALGQTWEYPEFVDSGLNEIGHLQECLARAADRIREKLSRNKNPIRSKLFCDAIRAIELAKDLYFDREYKRAGDLVFEAEKLLQEGQKA
jgi:hypothetical protein